MKDWKAFVLRYGKNSPLHELAAVVGQSKEAVSRVRQAQGGGRKRNGRRFAELFALWHGREPKDCEWPPLQRAGGGYEWQGPELALLATLVGRFDKKQISALLTKRLRKLTRDRDAVRDLIAVQGKISQIGMTTSDVVGGITASDAGREVGSYFSVLHSITQGKLAARKVGRIFVIPHAAWEEWKSRRVFPPKGYVPLSSIREPLGILSDSKLPEFAKLGYIETAIMCNPVGNVNSGRRGTWFIARKVALKLIRDRRAGRPMPWHGKAYPDNLKITFRLWRKRRHPASCATCAHLWGRKGPPATLEEFSQRYPPIARGGKRHLTRIYSEGLTVDEVAAHTGALRSRVIRALQTGALQCHRKGRFVYVTKSQATRWRARHCPSGDGRRSWISIETAVRDYHFKESELRGFIREKRLVSKIGTHGAARGKRYVARDGCAELRRERGFTEARAARLAGVSIAKFRTLLRGVNWRGQDGIPLTTVHAVIKRLKSQPGCTIEAAARKLGRTVAWVTARINAGAARVTRARWDRRRRYLTDAMVERLLTWKSRRPVHLGESWLGVAQSAAEAGVSIATLQMWADKGDLERRRTAKGQKFSRASVRRRARQYWKTTRLKRAIRPTWLQQEKK